MTPDEFQVYEDRSRGVPPPARKAAPKTAASCPNCGSAKFQDGFVEGTSDSLVRYYAGERQTGVLGGVKRFGIERRVVVARRCLGCSRLDLFAGEVTL